MYTNDVLLMSLVKIMCLDITSFRHHSNHVVLMSLLLHQKDISKTTSESFAYVTTLGSQLT